MDKTREEINTHLSGQDSLHLSAPSLSSPSLSRGWYRCCCCFNSSSREVPQTSTRYISPNSSINDSAITPPTSPTPTIRSEARADISDFVEEAWYHGNISWTVAEERLNALRSDCYLVRKSQSEKGKYILSVRYGRFIKHHPIRVQGERYEVEGTKKQFSTLKQLIAYYKQRHLSTEWETLVEPCSPPRLSPIMSKH